MCHGQIWRKSAVAKLSKSHLVLLTKKTRRRGHFWTPLHFAPLNRFRPKFHERCRPLTCVCVPTLVRIGCGLRNLFRKDSKKWKQSRLKAYIHIYRVTPCPCPLSLVDTRERVSELSCTESDRMTQHRSHRITSALTEMISWCWRQGQGGEGTPGPSMPRSVNAVEPHPRVKCCWLY